MEFFKRAKVFRLKCGHHTKYLAADNDEDTVRQSSTLNSTNNHWAIEPVEGKPNVVRFRSCKTFKYLATTDELFLTGKTGKKVVQRLRLDSSVEWEPIREGQYLKLKSRVGTLLRANPGLPPWRNTVTHDVPGHWTAKESMVNWIVDIVEIDYGSSHGPKKEPDVVEDLATSSSNVADQKEEVRYSSSSSSSGSMEKPISKTNPEPPEYHSEDDASHSSKLSRLTSAESMAALAINVARISIKELNNLEFHVILSSGQITKLEKAINAIASNSNTPSLANLEEKLNQLTEDHKYATEELEEYTKFSSRRYELRAELKLEVVKARELKEIDEELKKTLESAKALREELLKELEETDENIKNAEVSLSDQQDEIDELSLRIQSKTAEFKALEREKKPWERRKNEAERMLQKLEEEWRQVKDMLSDFW